MKAYQGISPNTNSVFPWLETLDKNSLSTSRGFVFQFPPFPTLPPVDEKAPFTLPETGLYFHIPFCAHKCSFCYYATTVTKNPKTMRDYLNALVAEMKSPTARNMAERHDVRTVYIGGGTPTALPPRQLFYLVKSIQTHFDCSRVEEFSVEATPNSLTFDKAEILHSLGVSRLSIGVQSFSDEINRINDRAHTAKDSLNAVATAREAGIDNINLDLICGLIGETNKTWHKTIDTLLSVAPEHVTTYLLSLRPQTAAFEKVKNNTLPAPPDEAKRIEFYLYARQQLLKHGYVQTTPNCYAIEPRFEHIHQRNAWSSLPLIGFGISAYSFVDNRVTQSVSNISLYKKRIAKGISPLEIGRELNVREQMARYAILRLKQLRIMRGDFQKRFGFDVMEVFGREIDGLEKINLLKVEPAKISLTLEGIVYADDVCRSLYTPDIRAQLARMEQGRGKTSFRGISKQREFLKRSLV
jgi:oxygen-independent coproporphyrinogen-3 oxidase